MICLDVEHVHIIHPMDPIIPTKVVGLRVNQAPRSTHSSTGISPSNDRFYPRKSGRVQVKDIVELAVLVRLAAKKVDSLLKSDS